MSVQYSKDSIRGSFSASDGLTLSYRVDDFTAPWKSAEPLVILHSAMGSSERFFSWVPRLADQYRVMRLDLRGHGQSQIPQADEPLTMERLVDDVREFMAEMGCERAHFVGASAGGYFCQRLAMDSPELVASLALFASTPGLKQSQAREWVPVIRENGLRSFLANTISDRFPIGGCDPELVSWFLDQAGSNDPEFIIKFVSLMTTQDWGDELVKIRCPALVVMPGLGKIGGAGAYEPMRRNIKRVSALLYENTENNICDFMADRCVTDLLSFLTHLPPDARVTH